MKTNLLKNIFLVWSWIAIATSASIFAAQAGTSIQANLVNLVQYLGELYITSDGTPQGDPVMHVDGSGNLLQIRQQDDTQYGILNDSTTLSMPYVGSMSASWDDAHLVGIQNIPWLGLLSVVAAMGSESEWVNYLGVSNRWIWISHIGEVGSGDSDNSIFVDADGIQFSFMGANKEYRFPTDAWQANQVLTTDGAGQLSWTDAGWSSTDVVISTWLWISYLDIQNMWTNPIEIVPEPGEGKFVQVLDASIKYNPGNTPYTMPWGNMVLYQWGNPSQFLFQFSNILPSLTPSFSAWYDWSSMRTIGENESVKLSTEDASNPTDGDGSIEVYVTYKIIDLVELPN